MEPLRCYCGFPISDIKEAFNYLRTVHVQKKIDTIPEGKKVHVDKRAMDPLADDDMSINFEILGLDPKKYCCLTRLTATIEFKELEQQDRF